MNIAYFKDMDSLYVEISPENPAQAWEAHEGIVLNLSEDGRVVGIEIEKASLATNLDILKIGGFPGQIEIIDRNRGFEKGQELINSAKVKNLATDFKNIPVYIYGYQDKFRALPGDDAQAAEIVPLMGAAHQQQVQEGRGRRQHLDAMARDQLLRYLRQNYVAGRLLIVAAGRVQHRERRRLPGSLRGMPAPAAPGPRRKCRPARVGLYRPAAAIPLAKATAWAFSALSIDSRAATASSSQATRRAWHSIWESPSGVWILPLPPGPWRREPYSRPQLSCRRKASRSGPKS